LLYFLLALPMIIAVAIPNIITGTVNNAEILEGINELSSVAEYAQTVVYGFDYCRYCIFFVEFVCGTCNLWYGKQRIGDR